jgi:hypothetical protein
MNVPTSEAMSATSRFLNAGIWSGRHKPVDIAGPSLACFDTRSLPLCVMVPNVGFECYKMHDRAHHSGAS